ncbi:MAG: LPS assembly protein LptD, partial [Desulfamplus sp.]|nr:LPS assembly protein LptD [Desulfamplus sp.]
MSYDNEKQLYIAEGDVVITGTATRLKADYVEFSNITRDSVASGNVLLVSGRDSITCDRLNLNLETETGTIYNGTVFIEQNHFYIKGDTINKTGKQTYQAGKASVTSCDGEDPDWKVSGKDIKVTIDGYGTARDVTLWAGDIPALYSPVLLFPAKTRRQTGLMTPRLSTSNRKGFRVEQPIFLAISRGMDATFHTDYMTQRGIKTALEYRYVLSGENYGSFFYDYLDDNKIDDGTEASADYSFASTPIRADADRYWFRMKNSHTFDNILNTRLDIDYVSDSDYLREFKEGFTGFNTVSKYFSDTFGRAIDEYDDTTRVNSLNINRTWSGSSLNMGAQWIDNVVARQTDSEDTTLQKLPSFEFNTVRRQIGGTFLYYDLDSEYRYFYRQDNTTDQQDNPAVMYQPGGAGHFRDLSVGHRTDIFPRVYTPLRFGSFYLEPSAGLRQSIWYATSLDEYSGSYQNSYEHQQPVSFEGFGSSSEMAGRGDLADTNLADVSLADTNLVDGALAGRNLAGGKHFSHREMIDFNLELSTKLSRVFNTDNSFAEKIRHEVLPSIEYSFAPDISQNDLPYFDGIDRIEEQNRITWSIGNRLTSRNKNKISRSEINSSQNGHFKDGSSGEEKKKDVYDNRERTLHDNRERTL